MKNLIVIAILFFAGTFTFAQDFEINEAPRAMNNGTYNSYLFELPDVGKKTAEDQWKGFIKDFKAKTKYNKKTKFWTAENVKIGRLSDAPLKVVSRILEDKNPEKRTSVIVWFQLSDGTYVNTETDEMKGQYAIDILTEYAMSTSKTNAMAVVKEQEKIHSSLEKDLKKLEKDNKDYNKEIEKAKNTIAENEKNIERNESDQRNKKKELEAQKELVEEAKDNLKKFN